MNKLEKHLIKIDTDLGGSPSVHPTVKDKLDEYLYIIESQAGGDPERVPDEVKDKLDWHLRRIEELLENGGGGSGKISFLIVDKLPETGEEGIVYLVPKKTIFSKNKYDEYVWIKDDNDFEYIGTGAFDPTGYATIEYVDTELLKKQNNLEFNVEVPSGEGITITSIKDGDNYYVIPSSGSTVDWTDIANKPEFAEVSFSGDYDDLDNKPELFSGSYNDLTDKPDLFSGSYNDLTDKPDLSIYAQSANLATVATSGSYSDLLNKPDLFEVPVFELEDFDPEEGIMELSQADLADIYTNKYELVYLHLNYEDEEEHFSYEFNLLFKLASAIRINTDLVLQYDFYSVDDEKEEDRAILDHISFKLGYDNEDHEYKTEVMEIYLDPEPTITWDAITNKPTFATVATSGSYTDLNDTPTNVSAFTNDAGYITTSYHDSSKQDTLVSGTNIKTINGESLLGSGNLDKRTITLLVDQETGDITMSQDDIDYLYTYRPSDVYVITPVAEGVTATQVYELVGSTVVADYDVDSLVYKTLDTTDSEFVTSTIVAIPHNASDPIVPVEQELALHSDIPAAQVNSDWEAASGVAQILNKPNLASVATSGSYADLSNTPLSSISVSQSITSASGSNPEKTTTTITLDGTATTIDVYTKIDSALSPSSKDPVANNVIFNALSNKANAEDIQNLEKIALTTRGILTGEVLEPVVSITDGNYYPTVSDSNTRWKMSKSDDPTYFKIYDVKGYNTVHLKAVSRAGYILTNGTPSDFNTKIHQNPTQVANWYEAETLGDSEQATIQPKNPAPTPYDLDITTNSKDYLIVYEGNAAQAIEVTYGGGYSPIYTSQFINDGEGANPSDPFATVSQLPASVSGTNDGTNWTSITIGNTTKAIPTPTGTTWGGITGTLADQTDLQNTLNTKQVLTPDFVATSFNLTTGAITFAQADLEDIYSHQYDLINIHYVVIPGSEMTFLFKKTAQTTISTLPMVRYDYTTVDASDNNKIFQLGFSVFYDSEATPSYSVAGDSAKYGQTTTINGLSGGTLTSPLIITGGDSSSAAKIAIDNVNQGQITDASNATIFGFLTSGALTVGSTGYTLGLRGSATRPTYNATSSLALTSDITVTDVQVAGGTSVVSSGIATIPALYSHYITFTNGDSTTYVCVNIITQVNSAFSITSFIQFVNQMFETSAALANIPATGTVRITATSHRAVASIKPGSTSTKIQVIPLGAADSGIASPVELAEGSGADAITSLNDVITRIL